MSALETVAQLQGGEGTGGTYPKPLWSRIVGIAKIRGENLGGGWEMRSSRAKRSFLSDKRNHDRCHQTRFLGSKCSKNTFSAETLPRTPPGELIQWSYLGARGNDMELSKYLTAADSLRTWQPMAGFAISKWIFWFDEYNQILPPDTFSGITCTNDTFAARDPPLTPLRRLQHSSRTRSWFVRREVRKWEGKEEKRKRKKGRKRLDSWPAVSPTFES